MLRFIIVSLAVVFLAGLSTSVQAVTVADVLDLLENGVSEDVILDQIDAENAAFDLSTDDILELKEAGASDDLIREMIGRRPDSSRTSWTDEYYTGPGAVQARLYYDPFGYHWYAWPGFYAYYHPFSWRDCGFYYAGWWNRGWCAGGPRASYYWRHYSWGHGSWWNSRSYAVQDDRSAWRRDSGRSGAHDRNSRSEVRERRTATRRDATGSQGRSTRPSIESDRRHGQSRPETIHRDSRSSIRSPRERGDRTPAQRHTYGRDRSSGTRPSPSAPTYTPRSGRSPDSGRTPSAPPSAPRSSGSSQNPRSGDRPSWRR